MPCTSTDQVEVVQDVQQPEVLLVQVIGDQNGQGIGSISISVVHTGSYAVAWYHNGNVIFNTENISGLTAGDYTVVVTGSNGCTGTLIVTVQDTGVSAPEKFDDSRWIVFPNPTDSRLFVRYLGEDFPDVQLLLLDATGRTASDLRMAGVSEMVVPCESLPSGVYTLLILSRERGLRRMVVIQK